MANQYYEVPHRKPHCLSLNKSILHHTSLKFIKAGQNIQTPHFNDVKPGNPRPIF